MRTSILLIVLFLSVVCQSQAASVYRWVDAAGNVHFTDEPPDGALVEEVEIEVGVNTLPPVPAPAAAPTTPTTPKKPRSTNQDLLRWRQDVDRRVRQEKCADYQEKLEHLRSRMRAGYRASQYNSLMEREASLKRKISVYCKRSGR
ncbi:MAG: DUF4124 domain-containing protein [Thiohalomonadaceae bacterium]